jgi:hypothetical protein
MKRTTRLVCLLAALVAHNSRGVFAAQKGEPSPTAVAPATDSPTAINQPLAEKVHRVLDSYCARRINTKYENPWSVLHWSIAYGIDAEVVAAELDGQSVSAIGWLCYNRPAAGQRLMSYDGQSLRLPIAPGLQGHQGQFLAMLAQSRVKPDYEIHVGSHKSSVADLVDYEKRTCRSDLELTFKLIGLAYYSNSEESWQNSAGQSWSVRRLLEEELSEPIDRNRCPCGGTHRLFALSYAVERRRSEGLPIDGPWQIAHRRTQSYQQRAFQLQNGDGSFSTLWLDARENRNDKTRKLTTSGHILEWLACSLPESQLHDPSFERAVEYVANLLDQNQNVRWHRGALGHALHALAIYDERVLDAKPGQRRERLALAD